jgi:hypothetical protein
MDGFVALCVTLIIIAIVLLLPVARAPRGDQWSQPVSRSNDALPAPRPAAEPVAARDLHSRVALLRKAPVMTIHGYRIHLN